MHKHGYDTHRQTIAAGECGSGLGVPERVRRHLACRHRARSRGSSGQRLLLLQDQGRDWRGDRRAEASGAVRAAAAMERSWIAQGSALRLRPRRPREQGFLGRVRLRGRDVLLRAPQGGLLGRHQRDRDLRSTPGLDRKPVSGAREGGRLLRNRNENGAFMKIVLFGANGKIGELVQKALAGAGHEIVKVGRKSGDFQVEIENRESVRKLYQTVGSFDAVAIAAGQVAFAPLSELNAEKWQFSLGSKLMGQINLVQEAIPFIKEKGSFTLVSGILNDEPIFAGVAASTVSGALEAFVRAAAIELPKGLRINVVSPTMLKESESQFAQFFTGMIPVEGWKVGQAEQRAILGSHTGSVDKVA